MPVDTMDDDGVAVDGQRTVVTDTNGSESNLLLTAVEKLSVLFQLDNHVVESWLFGTPCLDAIGRKSKGCRGRGRQRSGVAAEKGAAVVNTYFTGHVCGSSIRRDVYLCLGGSVVVSQFRGAKEIVLQMCLWGRPQDDVAGDARQSPIVLTFQERPTREAVDLDGDEVFFTSLYIVGDFEFRRQIGVFGIPHKLSVDPDVIAVTSTVETDKDILVLP